MAKDGASAVGGAGEPTLVATKLFVPQTRPGLVGRPRLSGRLGEAVTHPLTLVCAPAGYGKTTLVAEWLSRTGCPVTWLSLDEGDNDPVRFFSYLVAALRRVD